MALEYLEREKQWKRIDKYLKDVDPSNEIETSDPSVIMKQPKNKRQYQNKRVLYLQRYGLDSAGFNVTNIKSNAVHRSWNHQYYEKKGRASNELLFIPTGQAQFVSLARKLSFQGDANGHARQIQLPHLIALRFRREKS